MKRRGGLLPKPPRSGPGDGGEAPVSCRYLTVSGSMILTFREIMSPTVLLR